MQVQFPKPPDYAAISCFRGSEPCLNTCPLVYPLQARRCSMNPRGTQPISQLTTSPSLPGWRVAGHCHGSLQLLSTAWRHQQPTTSQVNRFVSPRRSFVCHRAWNTTCNQERGVTYNPGILMGCGVSQYSVFITTVPSISSLPCPLPLLFLTLLLTLQLHIITPLL